MSKFKKGDKVKCIDASMCAAGYLTEGRVYKVSEDLSSGGWMRLEGVENPYTAWNYSRFELVKDEPKFKAGDKVRNVSDEGEWYGGKGPVVGEVYTVSEYREALYENGTPCVKLKEFEDESPEHFRFEYKYELVTEPANACAVRYTNGIFSGTLEQYPSVEEARKAIAEQGYHGLTYEFFEMVPAGKMTITQTVTRDVIES